MAGLHRPERDGGSTSTYTRCCGKVMEHGWRDRGSPRGQVR